jgi:hypothetical protein
MKDKIIIGARKIGPGLKAFLKFNHFAGTTKIDLGGEDNIKRLAMQPLDPELFEMIILGTRHVRSITQDLLLDNWIPKGLPGCSDQDVCKVSAILTEHTYTYSHDAHTKVLAKRLEDILNRMVEPPYTNEPDRLYEFLTGVVTTYGLPNPIVSRYAIRYACYLNEPKIKDLCDKLLEDSFSAYDEKDDRYVRHADRDRELKALLSYTSEADDKVKPYILGSILSKYSPGIQVASTPEGLVVRYKPRVGPGRRPADDQTQVSTSAPEPVSTEPAVIKEP